MEITTSERALLGLFMAKIHRIDPDVLVVCLFMFFIRNTVLLYVMNSFVKANELCCCDSGEIKAHPTFFSACSILTDRIFTVL